jgi:hypothetical protein
LLIAAGQPAAGDDTTGTKNPEINVGDASVEGGGACAAARDRVGKLKRCPPPDPLDLFYGNGVLRPAVQLGRTRRLMGDYLLRPLNL